MYIISDLRQIFLMNYAVNILQNYNEALQFTRMWVVLTGGGGNTSSGAC